MKMYTNKTDLVCGYIWDRKWLLGVVTTITFCTTVVVGWNVLN